MCSALASEAFARLTAWGCATFRQGRSARQVRSEATPPAGAGCADWPPCRHGPERLKSSKAPPEPRRLKSAGGQIPSGYRSPETGWRASGHPHPKGQAGAGSASDRWRRTPRRSGAPPHHETRPCPAPWHLRSATSAGRHRTAAPIVPIRHDSPVASCQAGPRLQPRFRARVVGRKASTVIRRPPGPALRPVARRCQGSGPDPICSTSPAR